MALRLSIALLLLTPLFLVAVRAQSAAARPPLIFIPGLGGSELFNEDTNKRVWFKLSRAERDDLRLPLTADPLASRDRLAPRDVLRRVKAGPVEVDIYGSYLESLRASGYRETGWDAPQAENALYVFAYDWRRDNVENARALIRRIEAVKARLQRPDLEFDVVAHSMGGLIARYAAAYGDRDLPAGEITVRPDWSGAAHFRRIALVGTPNEGSILALNALVKGFTPFRLPLDLPFVQNLSRFDMLTIPAVYQLLPFDGTLRAFDENLQPLAPDVFAVETWDRYGWNPLGEKKFARRFERVERQAAPAFFAAALGRARRFQAALRAAAPRDAAGVRFYLAGSDCRTTPDGVLVRRTAAGFATAFKPEAFRRADGTRVSSAELEKLLDAAGDGIVARRSLLGGAGQSALRCGEHNFLLRNRALREELLKFFSEKM